MLNVGDANQRDREGEGARGSKNVKLAMVVVLHDRAYGGASPLKGPNIAKGGE